MNHIVITGGAAGIGAAVAQHLIARGDRVSVVDRVDSAQCAWWADAPASGRGTWAQADAMDLGAYATAVEYVAAQGLTGLVTCAGISLKEEFLDSTPDAWTRTLQVNLGGTATAAQVAGRVMRDAGAGGSIVTIASTVAFGYVNGLGAHYHASKGAIVALTRALASELAPFGVRVNCVIPGVVRTPMTEMMIGRHGETALTKSVPLRRIAQPDEIANAVGFLLSSKSAMVTGHSLHADAGQLAVAGHPPEGFPDLSAP